MVKDPQSQNVHGPSQLGCYASDPNFNNDQKFQLKLREYRDPDIQ